MERETGSCEPLCQRTLELCTSQYEQVPILSGLNKLAYMCPEDHSGLSGKDTVSALSRCRIGFSWIFAELLLPMLHADPKPTGMLSCESCWTLYKVCCPRFFQMQLFESSALNSVCTQCKHLSALGTACDSSLHYIDFPD